VVSDFARIGAAKSGMESRKMSREKFGSGSEGTGDRGEREKISAVTLEVAVCGLRARFTGYFGYGDYLRGEDGWFSSLPPRPSPILNLEDGRSFTGWGDDFLRADVMRSGNTCGERGFVQRVARRCMGERYFHMLVPDGHELSFARPLDEQRPCVGRRGLWSSVLYIKAGFNMTTQ